MEYNRKYYWEVQGVALGGPGLTTPKSEYALVDTIDTTRHYW